ncbi:MAG: hypothetical protein DRP01_00420 [Archaeoglobales archaeon]|nr:MAG: hypothetical protein DRP01_00420 [Archaeoglobales archaeon]
MYKRPESLEDVYVNTSVLYQDDLLPLPNSPVAASIYELFERTYPATGHLALMISIALASLCTDEERQSNISLVAPPGHGKDTVGSQFSAVDFVEIFDYISAAQFCLKYGGKYLIKLPTSLRRIPDGVRVVKKGRYVIKIDRSEARDINGMFFIGTQMDQLFARSPELIAKTLSLFNALCENGYCLYEDDYVGRYQFGSMMNPLKVGVIMMMVPEDLNHRVFSKRGYKERMVIIRHEYLDEENKLHEDGILRLYLPKSISLHEKVRSLLSFLDPKNPVTVQIPEDYIPTLKSITKKIAQTRGEFGTRRAARDVVRLIKGCAVLNKRSIVTKDDVILLNALSVMFSSDTANRLAFQLSLRSQLGEDPSVITRVFRNWDQKPLYSEKTIKSMIQRLELEKIEVMETLEAFI